MPVLGRLVTAMVTPLDERGALDLDGAQALAAHLVDHGSDTILVSGTTGESPTLSAEERWDLLTSVREAISDRAKVMVGTGTNNTATSVSATEKATELGADSILAVTPYYNKPSQGGLIAHFNAIAEATDLPVVLYDIPSRTSREIDLETLVELSEVQNIVGVKDAAGDVNKAAEVIAGTRNAPGGFEVYSGDDALNLPLLAVGAAGFISVASHLAGVELQDLAATFSADPAKANEINARLLPLYEALFLEPNPAPVKGALNRLGLPAGPVRLPLLDASEATVDAVLSALDGAGIPR